MSTEHAHWLERGDIYALGALDGEELKDFKHISRWTARCALRTSVKPARL